MQMTNPTQSCTSISIRFKVDTGTQANILTKSLLNNIKPSPQIQPTRQILTSFCGQKIPVLGTCQLFCSHNNGNSELLTFFIVEEAPTPILGFVASCKLQLIKCIFTLNKSSDNLFNEFADLFDGIGELRGECKIVLKEGAQPTKRIPVAVLPRFKEELERMERLGVIKKVTHPTDWVNSVVIVKKPDKSLWICIDPHDLNKAIKRPHHPMPTFDEAIQKHEGAKFFTKLDARHGYWSLVLDEESSELTTSATPFGIFKFRRMPFGLISAQDEFQRRMEEAFEGVPRFSVIVDTIIISGKSETEHDVNTRAALTRAREQTVKLNKAKCTLKSKSIPYFGHVISKDGIHPDPNKVNTLKEMPRPRTHKELQTLLGMLNYLSRYIPNLSSQNEPLRTLSKQQKFVFE